MEREVFRFADEKDVALILQFIKELAEYEKTPEGLMKNGLYVSVQAVLFYFLSLITFQLGLRDLVHAKGIYADAQPLYMSGLNMEQLVPQTTVKQHGIGNIVGQRACHIHGGSNGNDSLGGQRSAARLEAGDAIAGGTTHNGKAGVGTDGHRAEACRHCHRRACAGAAGIKGRVVSIVHLPAP